MSEFLDKLPKKYRYLLFCIVGWILLWPSIVLVFDPYGSYVTPNETEHFWIVWFVPTVVATLLGYMYKKIVDRK